MASVIKERVWKRSVSRHKAHYRKRLVEAAGWANRRTIEASGGRVSWSLLLASGIAGVSMPRSLRALQEADRRRAQSEYDTVTELLREET